MSDFTAVFGPAWPYIKVFLLLLGGAVGLPIPEDIALIAAGVFIQSDDAHAFIMAGVCYLGVILGDLVIYRAGWLAGPAIMRRRWAKRFLSSKRLHWIRDNLEKRGFLTIILARHLFYLRTATFLVCGAVRMNFSRFFLFDALAALITIPLMLSVGYFFADNYDLILHKINAVKFFVIILGVAILGWYCWRRYRRSKLTKPASAATL